MNKLKLLSNLDNNILRGLCNNHVYFQKISIMMTPGFYNVIWNDEYLLVNDVNKQIHKAMYYTFIYSYIKYINKNKKWY